MKNLKEDQVYYQGDPRYRDETRNGDTSSRWSSTVGSQDERRRFEDRGYSSASSAAKNYYSHQGHYSDTSTEQHQQEKYSGHETESFGHTGDLILNDVLTNNANANTENMSHAVERKCLECHRVHQGKYDLCSQCDSNYRPRRHDENAYTDREYYHHHGMMNRNDDSYPIRRDERGGGGDRGRRRWDNRDRSREENKRRRSDSDSYYRRSHNDWNDPEPHEVRKTAEWPPSFESSGASYVFDARSGLFYEASSNFFYDPKTKLYYGNKQQKYFRFSPLDTPPFQEVVQGNPDNTTVESATAVPVMNSENSTLSSSLAPTFTETANAALLNPHDDLIVKALGGGVLPADLYGTLNTTATSGTSADHGGKKKKIAISFKSNTALKSSTVEDSNASPASQPVKNSPEDDIIVETMNTKDTMASGDTAVVDSLSSKLHKKHEDDIEKWSQRGREIREKVSTSDLAGLDEKHQVSVHDTSVALGQSSEVKLTVSGQPICLICKRKFANLEKLRQHEQYSDLHKKNTALVSSSTSVSEKGEQISSSQEYKDRAQARRILYPEQPHLVKVDTAPTLYNDVIGPPPQVAPAAVFNENHIGNKMLQNMGWAGGSLGRSTASTNPVEVDSNNCSSTNGITDMDKLKSIPDQLRNDWERIEALASKGR